MGVVPVITIRDARRPSVSAPRWFAADCRSRKSPSAPTRPPTRSACCGDGFPDFLVGAGTVLDLPTLDRAVDAGASFVVAPGFNPAVVDRCLELGVPVIPGVSSPTDIEAALGRGLIC